MLMLPTLAFTALALGISGYLIVNASQTRANVRVFVPLPWQCEPTRICHDNGTAMFAGGGSRYKLPVKTSRRQSPASRLH